MSELIDTTEMYLRTVFELMEEGIAPLRARIAERLHQSGPTVSQTVARMERDGLLRVHEDRRIELSPQGYELAEAVMRKHRLAERLLTDVIGLDWQLVHDEACRWEHVISDEVEQRLVQILDAPTTSPYGNPIPGLGRLGVDAQPGSFRDGVEPLPALAEGNTPRRVVLERMSESIQAELDTLAELAEAGVRPGVEMVIRRGGIGLLVDVVGGGKIEFGLDFADKLYGRPA